jgi:hypothetical protein
MNGQTDEFEDVHEIGMPREVWNARHNTELELAKAKLRGLLDFLRGSRNQKNARPNMSEDDCL